MKIALAQNRPVVGDISLNLENHLSLIELAESYGAGLVTFPELSLTGYESERAAEFSLSIGDPIFHRLQEASDRFSLIIGVGFPMKTSSLPEISTIFFRPKLPPWTYSKQFLHQDEVPYFSPGKIKEPTIDGLPDLSFAICYELSVDDHCEMAKRTGSKIYLASVAKTDSGVVSATERLSELAEKNEWVTLMVNSVGIQDGFHCAGATSAWDRQGNLVGRLENDQEGVLVIDCELDRVDLIASSPL